MLTKRVFAYVICALVLGLSTLLAFPTVYPTGTTIYRPEKAWSGYTLHPNPDGAVLIDMNRNVVKQWKGLDGMHVEPTPAHRGCHPTDGLSRSGSRVRTRACGSTTSLAGRWVVCPPHSPTTAQYGPRTASGLRFAPIEAAL